MSEDRQALNELVTSLKQQRDELALKIHLGQAEAKQEFENLTQKLDDLTREYEPAKQAVSQSAENVQQALKLVAGELKDGFDRIRKAL